MPAVKHGGLSGKARQVRYRNRAARLYAQQMIDEYFGIGRAAGTGDRYIPIRSRKEFLPSVAHSHDIGSVAAGLHTHPRGDAQLELPLGTADGSSPARKPFSTEGRGIEQKTGPVRDRVIRFRGNVGQGGRPEQREVARESFLPFPVSGERVKSNDGFTFRGFLLGCAMGSAAAALVLLVLQTALG